MEKKEKKYYWIIPVAIVAFILICLFIVALIWSIFAGVNGILENASNDFKGSWLCDDTLNVDIHENKINTYSNDRSDVINATYKVNRFSKNNSHNEYELIVKTYKVKGNRTENTTKCKIEMDDYNKQEMKMTNLTTGKVIRCKKR